MEETNDVLGRLKIYIKFGFDLLSRWRNMSNHHSIHPVDSIFTESEVQSVVCMTKRGPKGGEIYHVDIVQRTCICGQWKIVKIPCSYACAT